VIDQGRTDVHQHLWLPELVDALRSRTESPYVRGWTLYIDGEPDFEIDPAGQDPADRAALDPDVARIVLSMSSPLGMESLPPEDAQPLLDAWHAGVLQLPDRFSAWASTCLIEPDVNGLEVLLDKGFVGLQLPATALSTPSAIQRYAPLLRVCEQAGRPVFVHPGPVMHSADLSLAERAALPAWWPAVVDYAGQLQASWWAWHAVGRGLLPDLRICFAAGGGLAAAHQERYLARGGDTTTVDRDVFVDTSSYGPRGIDALVRVLGIDVIVSGSDRPYAEPLDLSGGDAAAHAIGVTNPTRLLGPIQAGTPR
jgi:predicted TIM-barrel fold metal-dependent hydrolase